MTQKKYVTYRNFVFTFNNYPENFEEILKKYFDTYCRYMVFGKEIAPSTGTPHLQGYIELAGQMRSTTVNKYCKWSTAAAKGDDKANNCYTGKEGEDWFQWGKPKEQGRRTDIQKLHSDIRKKRKLIDIYHDNPCALKYGRGVDKYRLLIAMEDKKFEPVEVIVLYGPAGVGKTRRAYEIDPQLYHMTEYTSPLWFDGYDGHETILLDDFKGNIRYTYLLRLLDGYKFHIPVKGGFTWKSWKRVIITSNHLPQNWYNHERCENALERRISQIISIPPKIKNGQTDSISKKNAQVSEEEKISPQGSGSPTSSSSES